LTALGEQYFWQMQRVVMENDCGPLYAVLLFSLMPKVPVKKGLFGWRR